MVVGLIAVGLIKLLQLIGSLEFFLGILFRDVAVGKAGSLGNRVASRVTANRAARGVEQAGRVNALGHRFIELLFNLVNPGDKFLVPLGELAQLIVESLDNSFGRVLRLSSHTATPM